MNANAVRELEFDALLGEMARPLTHEFNNFLHSLLLQFAIMEHEGPEAIHARLGALKTEAKMIAGQIREWQRMKTDASAPSEGADLNAVVRDILASLERGSAAIEASLSPEPALVDASAVELKRLCAILLQDAAAAVSRPTSGRARIQTMAGTDEIVLIVRDNREDVSHEDAGAWFDVRREGPSGRGLLRAAAHGLARRLRGSIAAEKEGTGELLVRLTLPRWKSSPDRIKGMTPLIDGKSVAQNGPELTS